MIQAVSKFKERLPKQEKLNLILKKLKMLANPFERIQKRDLR
jgi:hypothetical protein